LVSEAQAKNRAAIQRKNREADRFSPQVWEASERQSSAYASNKIKTEAIYRRISFHVEQAVQAGLRVQFEHCCLKNYGEVGRHYSMNLTVEPDGFVIFFLWQDRGCQHSRETYIAFSTVSEKRSCHGLGGLLPVTAVPTLFGT
jgi:hypothetical protein